MDKNYSDSLLSIGIGKSFILFFAGMMLAFSLAGFLMDHYLKDAFIRLLLYEEGIELRAFYHRYFIPYDRIIKVSIEKNMLGQRLNITSGIDGIPDYVESRGKEFLRLAHLIQPYIPHQISQNLRGICALPYVFG